MNITMEIMAIVVTEPEIQKLPFTKVCTSTSPSLQILARLQFAVVLSHVVTPRNVLSDFCAILLPAAHALEVAMKVDRR